MKKKTLLFTLVTGLAWTTFSSLEDGPMAGGEGNHTGSAGTTASCGGTNCHADNSTTTTPHITITDPSNSIPVVAYTPGKVYTVRISGTNNSGNLPKFGLQLSSVRADNTSQQAGALATGSTANLSLQTQGTLQFIEHTAPISGTGSGNSWTYTTTCSWTAPAAGTGSVKFFMMMNAVDGNGFASGDRPNAATLQIGEGGTNIASTLNDAVLKIYPNPATNEVNILQANASTGKWNINAYDIRGKQVASQQTEVTNGVLNATINSSRWASGTYFIQLEKDGVKKVMPVVKQ